MNDGQRDTARAVAELADRLPERLTPLARLAYNYSWCWLEGGPEVFRDIHPEHWWRSGNNPRWVLEAATPRRLRGLAEDSAFVERVDELAGRLEAYLLRPSSNAPLHAERPVAYFCSEYGLHHSLPLYGGGLGVLAGDILKCASDEALPFVGVGLFYRFGYFHQRLDGNGWQHEYWTATEIERLPAVLVTGGNGDPLTIELLLRGRTVRAQVWRLDIGRVPLYLLDTDRQDNHPIDRWISGRLYVGDRQTRLAQYALLGIGGVRALAALGVRPALVHLNEGHAVLSCLERLRLRLMAGYSIQQALNLIQSETVFTTHTPVPAGNEAYSREEVEPILGDFLDSLGVPRASVYDLGRLAPGQPDEPLNLTALALRTSRTPIGVSRLHGQVARNMWAPLWPGRPVDDVPIGHVTNGVHAPSWMAAEMRALLDRALGPEWRSRLADPRQWERINDIPDAELWAVRCRLRRSLVEFVREASIWNRLARGEPLGYVEAAARQFDPEALTIGFARRVATYKRLYLLVRHPERGMFRLLEDGPSPIQLVVAGKAHPQDDTAKSALRDGFQSRHHGAVGRRVVFLEDYDMYMASRIVAGVDLWLNLPRPPLEASGTSGMKVMLNGGLNLSVLDGWWAEAYDGDNGWAIDSREGDPEIQDDQDAMALFDLLGNEVIPLFYDRGPDNIPHRWLQRVKTSMQNLIPQFTAERMLRDYVTNLYAPDLG